MLNETIFWEFSKTVILILILRCWIEIIHECKCSCDHKHISDSVCCILLILSGLGSLLLPIFFSKGSSLSSLEAILYTIASRPFCVGQKFQANFILLLGCLLFLTWQRRKKHMVTLVSRAIEFMSIALRPQHHLIAAGETFLTIPNELRRSTISIKSF